jgi:HEAT repeat protein
VPESDLLLQGASAGRAGLIALMVIVAVLFLGTVVLSVYAVVMRAVHLSQEKASEELTERWRDPVLSAVADPSLVTSVQELVEEDDAVHFLGFIIEYARRVRGEERGVLRALARPFLPLMVESARSQRTETRAWAIQTLGTLGLPEHAEVVVAALNDPSPLVAMVAARALARKDTPQYADAVLARLERFTDWNRLFLASMLAAMGPAASESLRKGLADEGGAPATRAVMAEALRLQGDFLAGDVAASVVRSIRDRELLASALRLLAAVGRPEHAAVVRPLCESEDVVVRAQALHALGALGGDADVETLVAAMDDADPWPALYAARGARDAGGRDALTRVIRSGGPSATLARQVLAEEGGA